MRNSWKRVCAVALAAAMAVTMLPVGAQAATAKTDEPKKEKIELIPNGDFENGSEGWAGNEGASVEVVVSGDDGAEGSTHVLHVKDRKGTGAGASYDLSGKLNKGTEYTITGKFMYKDGPATKDFNVTFQNGIDYHYRQAKTGAIKGIKGQWVDFTVTYTPSDVVENEGKENEVTYPFSTTQNIFFIETGWVAKPTAENDLMDYWIDDVSITYMGVPGQEPEKPEVESLLSNGSFELDPIDTSWKGMGSAKVARTEEAAHEGSASLKVSDYSAGWEGGRYELLSLWKDGKLIPGKKYTLTAWAKTASGSGNLSATIKGKVNGKDSYIGFGGPVEVNSTDWTKITGEISLADYDKDTDVMEMYWSWGKTVADGAPAEFYLDDVTLTTPSENIVRNGSFERGLEKWTGYEQGETEILAAATDEFHSGSQSVKVANRTKCTNGPAQDMSEKLTPGNYYSVSAWVKYTTGPDTKDFNLTLHSGTESSIMATGTVKKGEWTKIEGDWGMPYNLDTSSNILVVETPTVATPNAANDLMDFYVDDVSILKYKDNTQALAKKFGYGNPITTNEFGADPYAIEYDGRIYVYMTADDYEFSDKDNPYSNNFGYITSLRVVSSADLMNWTDHGEIEVAGRNGGKGPAMWASHSWAPAIAYKKVDG